MERRYRSQRPEIEQLPWGTMDSSTFAPHLVMMARRSWTRAAFQEHRTAAACALTLKALLEARAPLDLIALATRFPLDELAHVEMCARMAMELGGATPIIHEPDHLIARPREDLDPLMRCADLVVRFFCVGEALSIPMLRSTWKAALHPLPRGVLGCIVRDEAAHGSFGWVFLDWALPLISDEGRALLADSADNTVKHLTATWDNIRKQPKQEPSAIHALGWLESEPYLDLAVRSLEAKVLAPLRRRNIPVRSRADKVLSAPRAPVGPTDRANATSVG